MSWSLKAKSMTNETEYSEENREKAKKLAKEFCELHDEAQAEFFIECAELACDWERDQASQWFDIGVHLNDCECSSSEARRMIRAIYMGLQLRDLS